MQTPPKPDSTTSVSLIDTVFLRPRAGDGRVPYGIAANAVTNLVYTANSATNNVSIMDGSTFHVLKVVGAGTQPSGAAVNTRTNRVFISNGLGGQVVVLDGGTGATVATINAGGMVLSNVQLGLGVNEVTNKVYVPFAQSKRLSVIDGSTNTLSAQIDIGGSPIFAAVDQTRNLVYASVQSTNNLVVVNGATNTVLQKLSLGATPYGVAVDEVRNLVYVCLVTKQAVVVLDGNNGYQQKAIIPLSGPPKGISYNAATNHLFVSIPDKSLVVDINAGNLGTTNIRAAGAPLALSVNRVTNRVFGADFGTSSVTILDGGRDVEIAAVKIGAQPNSVAVNPATNTIYTVDDLGNFVDVIDGKTLRHVRSVRVGDGANDVAVNSRTNMVYAATYDGVTVIDGARHQIVTVVGLGGDLPWALAVDEETNTIFTSNSQSATVSVIDGATNTLVKTIALTPASSPMGIAVNPGTNTVYVALYFASGVAVVDVASGAQTGTVGTELEPMGIAVNPVTNLVYATTYFGQTTVIDGSTNKATATFDSSAYGPSINTVLNQMNVGDFFNNNLEVFDLGSNTQTQAVATGAGPYDTATDSTNGRIYTANLNDGTVSVLQAGLPAELDSARREALQRRAAPIRFSDRGSKG